MCGHEKPQFRGGFFNKRRGFLLMSGGRVRINESWGEKNCVQSEVMWGISGGHHNIRGGESLLLVANRWGCFEGGEKNLLKGNLIIED